MHCLILWSGAATVSGVLFMLTIYHYCLFLVVICKDLSIYVATMASCGTLGLSSILLKVRLFMLVYRLGFFCVFFCPNAADKVKYLGLIYYSRYLF